MNTVRRTIAAVTASVMCLLGTSATGMAPFVSVTASAEDKLTYGVLTFAVNNEGTITITGCDETAKEVEIPAEIYGMPVTKIGWNAFSNCIDLTSVTILEGITEIDAEAFRDCTMLEFVVIPDSVRRIGYSCFEGTKILDSQTDLVKYVDKWAIGYNDYCGSGGEEGIGAEIVIKDGTVGIANYAFGYLNQSIGWWMMPEDDAYGPSSVMFPDSLKYIGDGAFSEAHLLEHIDLPENLETIGWGAFMHSALSSISIPENVTKISEQAFGNCENLTGVIIPESVTVIDNRAFDGCIGLTEIVIPESVTEIGSYAFKGCIALRYLTCPSPRAPCG
ncbi:MAG: leucine-rich repeat domain-containing protein, partial [Oscillospiraceae bacterium]|nr:leucine-rich repeat domain-containing protein [Oscillospiraceae bacterium]